MKKYLRETKMLDYSSKNIQQLIRERNWNDIEEFERLKSIYTFVRDEILFGYGLCIKGFGGWLWAVQYKGNIVHGTTKSL